MSFLGKGARQVWGFKALPIVLHQEDQVLCPKADPPSVKLPMAS